MRDAGLRDRGRRRRGKGRTGGGGGVLTSLLFSADLQNSLVPRAKGSSTPTYTRATTATVWGFAAAAVTGASPILLTVASGEARFVGARRISEGVWSKSLNDGALINLTNTSNATAYVDASGPFGYLSEGARANIALQSSVFENVAWTKSNVTATDNDAVAPDGTSTAALLLATAANGTVIQDLGTISSAAHRGGLWIKRKTGTGNIDLTINNGSTWTTAAVTTTWTRFFSVAVTAADPDIGIRLVTDTDAVWVWNGQAEAAPFLSSDIPTTTTAVTRNADQLTYVDTNNILDAQGTASAEVTSIWSTAKPRSHALSRTSGLIIYNETGNFSTTIRANDGTATSISPTGASYENVIAKTATTWGAALTSYLHGAPDATPAAYDGTFGTGIIRVGLIGSTGQWFGTIRLVKIFGKELSASQVAGL